MTETQRGQTEPAPHPQEYAGGVDIKELLGILRRRRWVIMGTMLLLTTLAVLVGLQMTPKYTAKALVMIDPRQSRVVDVEAVMQGLGTDASTVETQIKVLTSRDYVLGVMESLRLFEDPELNPALLKDPRDVVIKLGGPFERLVAWMPDEWLIAAGLAEEPGPDSGEVRALLSEQGAIDAFTGRYKVTQEGRSYVIGISYTSTDPGKAAKIVNRAAQMYVEAQRDLKLDATLRASGFLGDRLSELRAETEAAEAAVEEYRAANSIIITNGSSLNEQELADLSRELIIAKANLAQRQARMRLIRELRTSGDALDSVAEVLGSPVIVNLRQQEALLLREEAELRTYFGDKHPRIQNLLTEKANLQTKIVGEIDRILRTMENEVRAEGARVAAIAGQMQELTGVNSERRELEVKMRQLESDAESSRRLYEAFLQRYKETREQQGIIESDSRVVSTAAPPRSPSSPGPRLFGAVGFTASAMLGTLLALLLERLDSGLRSARQVEQELGLPALGLVPRLERMKRGQKPHQYLIGKPLSTYTESLRAIFTSLQLSNIDNAPKVVLVTSSLPQEGKTTLALSLATFAARSGQKVLLMDLDLRHPSVQRDLGARPVTGFVEHMVGEAGLEEVILHDEEAGIDYLPIKRQTANPTNLLGSHKMKQLITDLRERYDYIVLDSAPLLGVTDSKVVALVADKVLFATQWEKTSADAVRNALAHLHEVRADIGGVVLTMVDVRKHARYGYGDVGQYYGKYHKYYVN
ncbi:polysaccharide biosynthesis tyrosine autokinase [Geminicoccaceae bacterium 1502E]|nr:polysaccharide biosynthesis tyrosine autokinase [Geminicoccaceae bacterium 1502E]